MQLLRRYSYISEVKHLLSVAKFTCADVTSKCLSNKSCDRLTFHSCNQTFELKSSSKLIYILEKNHDKLHKKNFMKFIELFFKFLVSNPHLCIHATISSTK